MCEAEVSNSGSTYEQKSVNMYRANDYQSRGGLYASYRGNINYD